MKKKLYIIFLIVIILCFITTGCVKQSNCDCCDQKIGRFVYYEEPQEIIFCAEKTETSGLYITPEGHGVHIVGYIPKAFRVKDTIDVKICLKVIKREICRYYGVPSVHKIKCIEKID